MNKPKISLILIYNNCENELEVCIKNVINQSFSDIEIICINNGSTDNSEEILKKFSKEDNRIKLISLPVINEQDAVKKIGLSVCAGDFVCFINAPDVIDIDFIKNEYITVNSNSSIQIENNHLYRRIYLENDKEISELIEEKVKLAIKTAMEKFQDKEVELQNKYNDFAKSNIENINNATYELNQRFNQLEKTFYDKNFEYQKTIQEGLTNLFKDLESRNQVVYDDISKVYEYINSEINKKGSEINKVYEEITKNYKYTEKLIADKEEYFKELANISKEEINNKIKELEKEIIIRYLNLKRLLDMFTDETDSKIKAVNPSNLEYFKNAVDTINIEKTLAENIDKIYEQINKNSSVFYEELSKMYKELNDKLLQIKQDRE